MKEIIISIIVLLIIAIGGIYIQKYLNTASYEITEKLKNLKAIISKKETSYNNEELTKMSQDIYEEWEETDEKWSIIVLHDELDLIETSLIEMKSSIEIEDFNRAYQKIEESIFLVNHINEKEKICLKNIF